MEKVPYSKSSCSRLIFSNQLIEYSLFLVLLWVMINTEERTLTALQCVNIVKLTNLVILDPSFVGLCLLKKDPITFCLTFIFIGHFFRKKNIRRNLAVSHYFGFVVKMRRKPETTFVGANFSSQMLIFFSFLGEWSAIRNSK